MGEGNGAGQLAQKGDMALGPLGGAGDGGGDRKVPGLSVGARRLVLRTEDVDAPLADGAHEEARGGRPLGDRCCGGWLGSYGA